MMCCVPNLVTLWIEASLTIISLSLTFRLEREYQNIYRKFSYLSLERQPCHSSDMRAMELGKNSGQFSSIFLPNLDNNFSFIGNWFWDFKYTMTIHSTRRTSELLDQVQIFDLNWHESHFSTILVLTLSQFSQILN